MPFTPAEESLSSQPTQAITQKHLDIKAVLSGAAFFHVAFYRDIFPLIFNGSQLMSVTPRDMGSDMVGRESETDAEPLADKLIEKVGFEVAERLIRAREPKGTRGRRPGLAYSDVDRHLILHTSALQIEWQSRLGCLPQDKCLPPWHELLGKIVNLCWDREVAERFGVNFGKLNYLGQSVDSVVKRLKSRPALRAVAAGYCAKGEVKRLIKLKQEAKNAVVRPQEQKLLWFSFTDARHEIASKSLERKVHFLLFETVEPPEAEGPRSLWLSPRLVFFPPLAETWDALHDQRPHVHLLPASRA